MTLNPDAVRLAAELRKAGVAVTDETQRLVVAVWSDAWTAVADEWAAAIGDLIDASADAAADVTRAAIARSHRVVAALDALEHELVAATQATDTIATQRLAGLVEAAATITDQIIAAQLPDKIDFDPAVWSRADREALAAIIDRTHGTIVALTKPLPSVVLGRVKSELVRGIALGENPRTVAERIQTATGLGADRADRIARTEMLDAHRQASMQRRLANNLVTGWVWVAALDSRTCPGCAAMHGTEWRPEDPGPDGHVRCRCVSVPVTKSWADLGYGDLPEPRDALPDAEEWFWTLPREDQLAMMGRRRLELLASGQIEWSDLAAKTTNPGWRDSWGSRPVADLETL